MTRTRRKIELTAEQRRELEAFTHTGNRSVKSFKRAAIILALILRTTGRRIPKRVSHIVSAWHTQRNRKQKSVDWQFTAADARLKLKRLYPQIIE
jgi:hypothetical protein